MRELQGVVDYKESMIEGAVAIEPKLDGWRVHARHVDGVPKLFSRNGIELPLPHIQRELALLIPQGYFFDGELTHTAGFEAIKGAIARQDEDLHFHVFDMVFEEFFHDGIDMREYRARREALEDVFEAPEGVLTLGYMRVSVHLVMMAKARDEGIEILHQSLLEQGYEGSVIKDPLAPYESGPTGAWMRIKPVSTVDCVIIGVERSETDPALASAIKVCDPEGVVSNVHSGISRDLLREMVNHPGRYVDLVVEISHRGKYASGKMRNASFVRLRPDKTAAPAAQGVLA